MGALPLAVQFAVVIDDITLAFPEVIQFGVARAAIPGLAVCLQVIAIDTNSIA